jgi:hypothetical protein
VDGDVSVAGSNYSAIYASGAGAEVNVTGKVAGTNSGAGDDNGIHAANGAKVTVTSYVELTSDAGTVGAAGVRAESKAEVSVGGNVTVDNNTKQNTNSVGVVADDAKVSVGGNVYVKNGGMYGVQSDANAKVEVKGAVTLDPPDAAFTGPTIQFGVLASGGEIEVTGKVTVEAPKTTHVDDDVVAAVANTGGTVKIDTKEGAVGPVIVRTGTADRVWDKYEKDESDFRTFSNTEGGTNTVSIRSGGTGAGSGGGMGGTTVYSVPRRTAMQDTSRYTKPMEQNPLALSMGLSTPVMAQIVKKPVSGLTPEEILAAVQEVLPPGVTAAYSERTPLVHVPAASKTPGKIVGYIIRSMQGVSTGLPVNVTLPALP